MKRNQKGILLSLTVVIIFVCAIFFTYKLFKIEQVTTNIQEKKYVVWLNTLKDERKVTYERAYDNIIAISLDEKIGYTSTGGEVYKIKRNDNYLVLRDKGVEYLFRSGNTEEITLDRINITSLEISYVNDIENNGKILSDKETISDLKNQLIDKNLVQFPTSVEMTKDIYLYSDDANGAAIYLTFIHDEDGNCFIFDQTTDITWLINHKFIEKI